MAVVWAIAAMAVALIALLDGMGSDAERRAGDAAGRVADLQRTLDRRLGELETRIGKLPQAGDVSRLNDRLARVEDRSAAAAKGAKDANEKLKDLEDRVESAESGSTGGADAATTTPDEP